MDTKLRARVLLMINHRQCGLSSNRNLNRNNSQSLGQFYTSNHSISRYSRINTIFFIIISCVVLKGELDLSTDTLTYVSTQKSSHALGELVYKISLESKDVLSWLLSCIKIFAHTSSDEVDTLIQVLVKYPLLCYSYTSFKLYN